MYPQTRKVTVPVTPLRDITTLVTFVKTEDKAPQMAVILTELAENEGPSVTNAIERLASAVCLMFPEELGQIPPTDVLWLEHYSSKLSYRGVRGGGEWDTVDLVSLSWDANPGRYRSPEWRQVAENDPREYIRSIVAITRGIENPTG
ncbi:MAG: hypothetical protein ACYDHM_02300 [Acidiferrobacterales bacterium]